MWIVAGASFALLIVATIVHTFNYQRDYHIPADEVVRTEALRTQLLTAGSAGHV